MKFLASSVLAAALLTCTANAAPPIFGRRSSAAAYFMTNEPTGNFVVSMDIDGDGKLSLAQAVATRGRGDHGATNPIGPGPFFSQGAIKVSPKNHVLAAVNAGSNTISMFSVNPDQPADLKLIGEPIFSGGEFPVSLAFNQQGTTLCVLNGGKINGVYCYRVDPRKGLKPVDGHLRELGLPQTTPPNGPPGSASQIIFSEDGKQLIASVKGIPPKRGFLAVWDVNRDDTLSPHFTRVAPKNGGVEPFSMTLIPGKNALLATDAAVGFDTYDLSGGDKHITVASVVPIPGQMATCWSTFSKKTGNFYLSDVGTSTVTEVHVDKHLKGTIVKQYPQASGSSTFDVDVASIHGDDFLYVLSAAVTKVDVLSLRAPGQAQHIQSFDFAKIVGHTINPNNVAGMATFVKN